MAWTKLVDLELDDDERAEAMPWLACCPTNDADAPKYPPGLSISLCKVTLEKLAAADGMFARDPEVGDIIDIRCFARVTCVSRTEQANGEDDRRVELQITQIALEDENDEEPGDDD